MSESQNSTVQNGRSHAQEHPEKQYLNIVRQILGTGVQKGDRTGTGTLSVFGTQSRYCLRNGTLPLLTTKRVFWKGVLEELLWFLRGSTNAKELFEKNVFIRDTNGSRNFLDKMGFTDREEGDLGPVYGFQWRHFGADYVNMRTDYTGQGVDQISQLIETIRSDPNNRRLILSAWNVKDLPLMALPPCHCFAQFYVANGELSCQLYQRSADIGLGVPFNIASYALLTHILAHYTGLKAGEFVHSTGDTHIYLNHIEPLKLQIEREPKPLPKLEILAEKNVPFWQLQADHFKITGYEPHANIKMDMAV